MATKEEMEVLEWFLKKYPNLFPGVTPTRGSGTEDWAGIDAWLVKDGEKKVSLGIRRHGANEVYREFSIRAGQQGQDTSRFELAKLWAGGGPNSYLQVWEDSSGNPCEFVLVNMCRMRAAGCLVRERFREFWQPDLFKKSGTWWARMPVKKLIDLPSECVVLADVWNRSLVIDEQFDQEVNPGDPRQHFKFQKRSRKK